MLLEEEIYFFQEYVLQIEFLCDEAIPERDFILKKLSGVCVDFEYMWRFRNLSGWKSFSIAMVLNITFVKKWWQNPEYQYIFEKLTYCSISLFLPNILLNIT